MNINVWYLHSVPGADDFVRISYNTLDFGTVHQKHIHLHHMPFLLFNILRASHGILKGQDFFLNVAH